MNNYLSSPASARTALREDGARHHGLMITAQCPICGTTENEDFDNVSVIEFADCSSSAAPLGDGLRPGSEAFCSEHITAARTVEHLPLEEALEHLRRLFF